MSDEIASTAGEMCETIFDKSKYICTWPKDGDVPRIHIPEECLGQEIVVGIDEAGRGPVLGSLTYCAAFWPVSKNEEICKLGFDDSKQLKEGQRESFFDDIRRHPSIGWVIEELTAETISKEMQRRNAISLNLISYNAVVRMLEKIRDTPPDGSQMTVTDVFVDTVGDPEYYKSILLRAMGDDFATKFTIEKKADATYKVVSAASIIAKVTRDRVLNTWVRLCTRVREDVLPTHASKSMQKGEIYIRLFA